MKSIFRFRLFVALVCAAAVCACTPTPDSTPAPDAGPTASSTATAAPTAEPRLSVFQRPRLLRPATPDPRSPDDIAQAACTARNGAWVCPTIRKKPTVLASSGSMPIIPSSWTVPNWYIDPANSTTCASDANNCTSATCGAAGSGVGPCLKWQQINSHRWGCEGNPAACPRLQQNTVISWLSSQSDNSDPVYSFPALEKGAYMQHLCVLGSGQTVGTGTLGTVTAKNRSTPQLLKTTFSAGISGSIAINQLVKNTTHSSTAFVFTSAGGGAWNMTQPLVPVTVPYFGLPTSEVDTWATGNAVTVYSPSKVNFVNIQPTIADWDASVVTGLFITTCTAFDPNSPDSLVGLDQLTVNPWVRFSDTSMQRVLNTVPGPGMPESAIHVNTQFLSGYTIITGQFTGSGQGNTTFLGGQVGAVASTEVYGTADGLSVDLDTIFTNGSLGQVPFAVTSGNFGDTYLDTSVILQPTSGEIYAKAGPIPGASNPSIFWGPGAIDLVGPARFLYGVGAGKAATQFVLTGGLQIATQSKVCVGVPSVGTPTLTCNITLSATTLDSNLGATSGCLWVEGAGSFCNFGP